MTSVASPAEFTFPQVFNADRRSPLRWIWSHAAHHWWLLVMIFIGALGNAGLAAFVPVYIGDAFNAMLKVPPNVAVLLPAAIMIAVTQFVRGILQLGRNFGSEWIAQKIERDIREELYASLLGKSMTFHNLQPVGDTMARATNDVREVNFMFSPGINLVVGSLLFLVMPFIFVPQYSPKLLLTPALFTIAYFLALANYLWALSPISDEIRATFGKMNTHLSETLDGVEVMKGAAQEEAEVQRFTANARRVRDVFVRQGDVEARFLPNLLLGLAFAGGMTHALLLFRAGEINLGAVVGYFGLLRMLEFPTFTSSFAYTQISLGISGARRILELINRENNLDQNIEGYAGKMRGEIEFRDVSFAYPLEQEQKEAEKMENGNHPSSSLLPSQAENVIEAISFKVKPGQTVAIVGQTGAGKTSMVKLVNRTYDVTSGQVLVDGVDVRDWNLADLRSQISMIEQDIFLFSRSISENIAFGKPGAAFADVENAAQAAQADEFVESFDQGYETIIGERGVTLSGGQRQRLALARAFLTDPRILILDDSTSAIDSATEDKIQRAIANAAKGRTTIIITHRLSQIRWADLIIVMRKGKIAAIGSHDELLKTSQAYSRLFRE
jgi:ATP-binding cassette, subfamily B, bacterial